jgi:hypothetical protein
VWEKYKLSFDGGNSGSKKCKEGCYGFTCDGVWQSLCLEGVWSHAVFFFWVHLAGIWLQLP